MTRFDYVEYLCGPGGCGGEDLMRAVVYLYGGGACVSFLELKRRRWVGPALQKALDEGAEAASSDTLYTGSPAKCREDGAAPARLDVLTLDVDLKPPPVMTRVEDGRVVFADRATGEVVKRVAQGRLGDAVREVARRYGARPAAVYDALYWGGGEHPSWQLILRKARHVARTLARLGVEALFVYSGAKGFHLKLTLPKFYAAEARPALARGLAQLLDVEADPAAFDVRRKFRVPWTVNKKTGQLAKIFDPNTGEEMREFKWPRPVDTSFVGYLLPRREEAPRQPRRPRPSGVLRHLASLVRENPRLREDCRKRFTAAFGCFCAAEGVDAEACAEMLEEMLGASSREYLHILRYKHRQCAGGKVLFSIKELVTCSRGVWYCIKECLTPQGFEALREAVEKPAAETQTGVPGAAPRTGPAHIGDLLAELERCAKLGEAERCVDETLDKLAEASKGSKPWFE